MMQHQSAATFKKLKAKSKMPSPLRAAATLFLVQLTIVKGQFQYNHGAKKQYLLVEIPGEFDKQKILLGQDSTFFRGILGKMQSKDLKNCPRNSSEAKSSEDSF